MRETDRIRHHRPSYVAAHVRHPTGTRPGLRSRSARCGPGAARARMPDIDAGLHARHRSSDEEGHHRDDRAAGGTWRCPVTAAAAATPSQLFDADWAAKWREHLIDVIDPAWRPDEYDHAQLMFVPASRRAQADACGPGAPRSPCAERCAYSASTRSGCRALTPNSSPRFRWPASVLSR